MIEGRAVLFMKDSAKRKDLENNYPELCTEMLSIAYLKQNKMLLD